MVKKKRILIVDDVSSNIHLLMSILKEEYTIIAATNATKALELAKKEPLPDLILTDILMPEIDGYELCQNLKKDETTATIPLIFVSSLNTKKEREKGFELGALDFIIKPFSKDLVLKTIAGYLENKVEEPPKDIIMPTTTISTTNKPSVLIVDDSPENLQVIIEVLKEEYTVSVATSGEQALEKLESNIIPDLILLDVVMPNMDGYELCTILKSKKEFKNIPIIFVTILEKEQDIVKGLELGAVDYVVKPIEPVILKARIKTHLKLKFFQDQLMTDLKQKDELLLNQSKLVIIGELFENITHQWKQPLSAISISTGSVRIEQEFNTLDNEKLNTSLDNIETSVKYLAQTVDDFRNFLVNDTNKHRFNIKDIVEKTLILLSSKFKVNAIDVENNVKEFELLNYQNDLIQVLMNILTNAQDALIEVNSKRTIIIDSLVEEEQLIIRVKDNAGGIILENIDQVFDKYFTTKGDKEGSGVGLFMSQKIAKERLDGEIKAFNEKDGACFEIHLPLKLS